MYRVRYRMSGVVVMRKKKNLAKLLRSTGHTSSNQVWSVHSEISRKPKIYSSTPRELMTVFQYSFHIEPKYAYAMMLYTIVSAPRSI